MGKKHIRSFGSCRKRVQTGLAGALAVVLMVLRKNMRDEVVRDVVADSERRTRILPAP